MGEWTNEKQAEIVKAIDRVIEKGQYANPNKKKKDGLVARIKGMFSPDQADLPTVEEAVDAEMRQWKQERYDEKTLAAEESKKEPETLAASNGEEVQGSVEQPEGRQMEYAAASDHRTDFEADKIKKVQEGLIAGGYDVDKATGVLDEKTMSAVKIIQRMFGQEVTGMIDDNLYGLFDR